MLRNAFCAQIFWNICLKYVAYGESGANFKNTPHNREMMKKAVDELLISLRK